MKTPRLSAGIDAGTSAIKVAVLRSKDGEDGEILATNVVRIRRRQVQKVVQEALSETLEKAGVALGDLIYLASTGDSEAVLLRTGHFYSMTTHSRGALFLCPKARSVLDIGALHARAMTIDGRGKVLRQKMTSQCASGSGQFLESIARYLGIPLDEVGARSVEAKAPETVSSICAVLAETDVINMVSRGIKAPDILKGIHLSIAGRLVRLLRSIRAEGEVLVTGGLAGDRGMLRALSDKENESRNKSKKKREPLIFHTHEQGILAGAIGAGLLGAFRYAQLERQGRELPPVPRALSAAVLPTQSP